MNNIGTIIYVGGFELPDKNAAAHRVLNNGKIFRDLGYNVVFIGIDKSLKKSSNILETFKKVQGFDTWAIPYPSSMLDWSKYLIHTKNIEKIIEKYDTSMVIAYNYQALALNRLRRYCIKHNLKIISDCTEWYSTKGTGLLFKIIKGTDSFLRMRIVQKKLDGVIVISNYLKSYYEKYIPTIILPPLVDLHEEKWKMLSFKNNINDKIRIVYSGTPGREKDKVNYLIDILYGLNNRNNIIMDIVGISQEEFLKVYPRYESEIISLSDNLVFHGRVSHTKSLNILKNADVCMFIREDNVTTKAGFPTKFVESLSAGTPVITTKSSDLIDYLDVGNDGYFIGDINDSDTQKKLEDLLIINPEKVINLKKYKIVNKDKFSYEKYKKSVLQFLCDLN